MLKIASEFVDIADADPKSAALAGAIVAMGRSLGIQTVAEGIETAEQAARMRALGCNYGQGFHFARPVAEDEMAGVKPAARVVAEDPVTVVTPVPLAVVPDRPPRRRRRPRSAGASAA